MEDNYTDPIQTQRELNADLALVCKRVSLEKTFLLFMVILILPLILVLTIGPGTIAKAGWFVCIFIIFGYWGSNVVAEWGIRTELRMLNKLINAKLSRL